MCKATCVRAVGWMAGGWRLASHLDDRLLLNNTKSLTLHMYTIYTHPTPDKKTVVFFWNPRALGEVGVGSLGVHVVRLGSRGLRLQDGIARG